ncbi:MAG: PHP domain-containing protein, partial [Hyphomicrobium sp.]
MPEKILPNIDLHNHSNASDGLLSPRALIELAHQRRCDVVALTDHDTTAGIREAETAAAEIGLRFVRGVEISVTWPFDGAHPDIRPITVHIVGLNIDPGNAVLAAGLKSVRDGRLARARLMDNDLQRVGV